MKNLLRRKGKLICFVGIDGSGKTTLTKGLIKMMNERGKRYKYVYGKLEPFILNPFIILGRLIFLRGKDMFRDYAEYSSIKRDRIKRSPILASIYRNILLFDYFIRFYNKREKIRCMLG